MSFGNGCTQGHLWYDVVICSSDDTFGTGYSAFARLVRVPQVLAGEMNLEVSCEEGELNEGQ